MNKPGIFPTKYEQLEEDADNMLVDIIDLADTVRRQDEMIVTLQDDNKELHKALTNLAGGAGMVFQDEEELRERHSQKISQWHGWYLAKSRA